MAARKMGNHRGLPLQWVIILRAISFILESIFCYSVVTTHISQCLNRSFGSQSDKPGQAVTMAVARRVQYKYGIMAL